MSEEILKALMQLFAILAKQDGEVSETQRSYVEGFLKQQLSPDAVPEYLKLYDKKSGYGKKPKKKKKLDLERPEGEEVKAEGAAEGDGEKKMTSMGDSVRTLGICKKINKTLEQKQKIVVFVRLLELVWVDKLFSPLAMEIIDTVAEVFKIPKNEYDSIKNFTTNEDVSTYNDSHILFVDNTSDDRDESNQTKHMCRETLDGTVVIIKVESADLYFVKCAGNKNLYMNGLPLLEGQVYLFPSGSTIKLPSGKPIYYSDIVARFLSDSIDLKISFTAKDILFRFPNGNIGLQGINISEETGKLVGIMGASGAGKSTLLNVLNGNDCPTEGAVLINGVDIHRERDKAEGVIGYVPQDDLLIDELTVYQNLYYNAKLCLNHLSEEETDELIINLLKSLDLMRTKDLKVGNPLEKTISGGQRKRLNIGLELMREPAVMFVDEPTSGLSSRDSENIMDLLKELALKGKIIFVVIHQPSSDIYKMFDRMVILDVGGYPIYYGNPVEAVTYFKKKANQVNSESGECETCGNVNPELIFNIIDAKLVDDYGRFLDDRKVTPEQWNGFFTEEFKFNEVEEIQDPPPNSLSIPTKIKQWLTFTQRDVLSKIKNTQYMYLNMLEAPVLAFILSFIIRYTKASAKEYTFRDNENIPAYIFMSIVVALFLGLMVSAEEIIKDQKILKREKFLNLSKTSYLFSKIGILFTISALQTSSFVIVGNLILGVDAMWFPYWFVLFTTSCFANMLGLNISASFNSAITIYILIPLLLIPQMILSGAMFSFDKINSIVGGGDGKVPIIADVMVSRWAYEALAVQQFKGNPIERDLFELDKRESDIYFKQAYYLPRLIEKADELKKLTKKADKGDSLSKTKIPEVFNTLKPELDALRAEYPDIKFKNYEEEFNLEKMSKKVGRRPKRFLDKVNNKYIDIFAEIADKKDSIIETQQMTDEAEKEYRTLRNSSTNKYLEELLKNSLADPVKEVDGKLVPNMDPIFRDPTPSNALDFRGHFYAPTKHLFGMYIDTFTFNLLVVWFMTLSLYISLYFDLLKKLLNVFSK